MGMLREFLKCRVPALTQGKKDDDLTKASCQLAPFPSNGLRRWNLASYDSRNHVSVAPGINKWANAGACDSILPSQIRPKRPPFVKEADRLQEEFDNDFGEYIRSIESGATATKQTKPVTYRVSIKGVVGEESAEICQANLALEAAISAAERAPSKKIVKTLHLGPKEEKKHAMVRCNGYAGVRAVSSWVACDFEDKWQSVNSHRTCDKHVPSLKCAMALSCEEDKMFRASYRNIGAAERSLKDRSPRSNPDCTRPPLPNTVTSPRSAACAQTQASPTMQPPSHQMVVGPVNNGKMIEAKQSHRTGPILY